MPAVADAYFYFAEQTSPEDMKINFDVIHGPGSDWWVEFDACIHEFELMNKNNRQYLGDNIWGVIQSSDKIQYCLKVNDWFGEMDHPYPTYDKIRLSEKRVKTVELSRRSHKITLPRREGHRLFAHIISAGNDVGKGFANEIIRGMIPAFSCRCFGVLQIINGKPTVVVKIVVTYDWVLYPGFGTATMTTDPKVKIGAITESAEENGGSHDIAIPITELTLDIAEKDGGVKAYLESMDLNETDVVGVTADMQRAVISPDKDHYIYAKMNPATVDRVRDFYKSFKM